MKFRSLDLQNWGPFVGVHSIELMVSDASPVVVLHGENGRGKTSIMRAIFWCLYGTVRDSYGTLIPLENLVNRDCARETNSSKFSVKLSVEFESTTFEILREGSVRTHPQGLLVEEVQLTLRPQGSSPYSESKALETINLMLEEAIADFYLFDGEKLSSVEKKLSKTDSESQQFVQKSVERALGLSFIDRLKTDLDFIRNDFSDILTTHAKLETETQKLVEKQAGLTASIAKEQEQATRIIEMRAGLEGQVSEINKNLQEYDAIRDLAVKRQLLVRQEKTDQENLDGLKQKLRAEAETNWHWPLTALLASLEEQREKDSKERSAREERIGVLRSQIQMIQQAVNSHECSMCGLGVSDATERKLTSELQVLNSELEKLEPHQSVPDIPNLSLLTNFAKRNARLPLLEEILDQVGKAEVALINLRSEIAELNAQIGSGGTPDILKLEEDRDQCIVRISQATNLLKKVEESISSQKTQLQNVQQKLKESPELDPVARTKLSIIDGLREILTLSYEEFREAMRAQVEVAASKILQKLSSEKEFKNVGISPKYQVSMLDGDHQVVPIPSSGYSQILALSFIGGLAEVAGSSNAVVMDTPWGRVDRGNRKLIIEWIKSRSNQTIIFVQSGELTIPEAREEFGSRLGRQLSIERVSLNSSKVVGV